MNKASPLEEIVVRVGGSTRFIGSYGYTRDGGSKLHKGVDYVAMPDTPVYAAHDGVIIRDGFEVDDHSEEHNIGYGCRIWLRGSEGVETRYAHLHGQIYKRRMTVDCGDQIGWTGHSGNSDKADPHLHFEVRTSGKPVNPEWWLERDHREQGYEEGAFA